MKFTIKTVNVDSISVEYADGSTAVVPTEKDQSKESIIQLINSFHNTYKEWDSVDDVPVKVGDELEYVAEKLDDEVDYKDARRRHYPTFGTQFDALYWAREGDDTQLKNVDARIKNVKDKIPKDKTYKIDDLDTLLD
tara:strand:+ start:80 stop:490 length:411 start_codon:yes stop_codon:yes gene_type:complete